MEGQKSSQTWCLLNTEVRTNTYKVQPDTFYDSDKEDLLVLVLRVSGKLNIRAQDTSSIYSVIETKPSPSPMRFSRGTPTQTRWKQN